jgi:hypothetical protein
MTLPRCSIAGSVWGGPDTMSKLLRSHVTIESSSVIARCTLVTRRAARRHAHLCRLTLSDEQVKYISRLDLNFFGVVSSKTNRDALLHTSYLFFAMMISYCIVVCSSSGFIYSQSFLHIYLTMSSAFRTNSQSLSVISSACCTDRDQFLGHSVSPPLLS